MALRLDKFTAPRLLKALEAKIAAIRADKSAREASYELERARLKKLGDMIEFCTLRAPGDGIVVYAKESNGWGRTTAQIEQGVTVRQGQAIFHLPDPKNMLVKTRINESKVSLVRPGQRAEILIDAFPDHPLRGTVRQVTAIPTPLNGPFSDVRAYFATVAIDEGGLEGLRPGLSAQVSFEIGERRQVTRVPLQAIRRVGDATFAAVWTSATRLPLGLAEGLDRHDRPDPCRGDRGPQAGRPGRRASRGAPGPGPRGGLECGRCGPRGSRLSRASARVDVGAVIGARPAPPRSP